MVIIMHRKVKWLVQGHTTRLSMLYGKALTVGPFESGMKSSMWDPKNN